MDPVPGEVQRDEFLESGEPVESGEGVVRQVERLQTGALSDAAEVRQSCR